MGWKITMFWERRRRLRRAVKRHGWTNRALGKILLLAKYNKRSDHWNKEFLAWRRNRTWEKILYSLWDSFEALE